MENQRHSPVYRDALYKLIGDTVVNKHFLRKDCKRHLKELLATSFSLEMNRFTYGKENYYKEA